MENLDKFEGHIMLYCKGQYTVENVDFLTGLRRIWAIRCGLSLEHIDPSIDEYLANALCGMILKINPNKVRLIFDRLHSEISKNYLMFNRDLTSIERIIMVYRGIIIGTKVKDKNETTGKWEDLIKLPKPQIGIFKRIIKGKGKYEDFKLIK